MKERAQGFTLIELMIGLTLISMAFTIAFAALRFATRSMERTERLVGELEEVRIVQMVAQSHLAQARPLRIASAEMRVDFRGEGQQLEFVAPVPLQHERLAGLYRYRLTLQDQHDGKVLALDYTPYQPGEGDDWPDRHESTVLMRNISVGEFRYFGSSPDKVSSWQENWLDADRLPDMIRIVLQQRQSGGAPLDIVIMIPAGTPL